MTDRMTGKIFSVSKQGWGFIISRDIEFTRIFFHWTNLKQDTVPFLDLRPGMIVEFTPMQVEGRGWRATYIKVLSNLKEKSNESTDMSTL